MTGRRQDFAVGPRTTAISESMGVTSAGWWPGARDPQLVVSSWIDRGRQSDQPADRSRRLKTDRLWDGQLGAIAELAESERISDRYVARVLRLTLLAPDIVEAILDGRLPKGMGLAEFMGPWPVVWGEQWGRLTCK